MVDVDVEVEVEGRRRRGKKNREKKKRKKIGRSGCSVALFFRSFFFHPSSSLLSLSKTSKTNMATVARSAACTGVARFAAPGENGNDEKEDGAPRGKRVSSD